MHFYSMENSQFVVDLNVKDKTRTPVEGIHKCFIDPKIGGIFSYEGKSDLKQETEQFIIKLRKLKNKVEENICNNT